MMSVKLEIEEKTKDGILVIEGKKINILEIYEIAFFSKSTRVVIYTNKGDFSFEMNHPAAEEFIHNIFATIKDYLTQFPHINIFVNTRFFIQNNIVAPDGLRKEDLENSLKRYEDFLNSDIGKRVLKTVMDL